MANIDLIKLAAAIKSSGKAATALALEAGMSPTGVRDLLKGKSKAPSLTTISAIADALGLSINDIIDVELGLNPAPKRNSITKFLTVRHKVQAGAWFEADQQANDASEMFPVAENPKYAGHPQWLEQIVGNSVDLIIPDGALAHVIDAVSLEYTPKDGDLVIVERTRDGGHIRERTIKQVRIPSPTQIELWPRSTDARFQDPITYAEGDEESVSVAVVGLVVGSYRPL